MVMIHSHSSVNMTDICNIANKKGYLRAIYCTESLTMILAIQLIISLSFSRPTHPRFATYSY